MADSVSVETTITGRVYAVAYEPAGSDLLADATTGDTVLELADTFDFAEEGGTVTILSGDRATFEAVAYTGVIDDDAGTVELAAPLVNTYESDDGAFATPDPDALEVVVQVVSDDDPDELIEARALHRWIDVLPEGIRDPGDGEAVTLRFDGTDWVVDDILGETPAIDGTLIDPGTLPPPDASDGLAPGASPTANVVAGISSLIVQWLPVTNHDPVTYEVHISTTTGFTPSGSSPGSGTFAVQTQASQATIRSLPDGTALDYATVYYVKVIAKDTDGAAAAGAQGSGSPAQVTGGDIAVETITAANIVGDSITADKLSSTLVVAGTIETAAEGQRTVIDTQGAHLFAPDGSTIVDLPNDDATPASFNGELDASALSVRGLAQLLGETQVLPNAELHLVGGQPDPALSPSLSLSYPIAFNFDFGVDGNAVTGSRISHYSAAGGAGGATPCYYGTIDTLASGGTHRVYAVEWLASNGHINRSVRLDQGVTVPPVGFGACVIGGTVVALNLASATGILVLQNIDRSTFTIVSDVSTLQPGTANLDPTGAHVIGFGCDGTNPYMFSYNSTTKLPNKIRCTMAAGVATGATTVTAFSSSAVKLFSPGNANNLGDSGGPINVLGAAWDGTNWYVNYSWANSAGSLTGRLLQMYVGSTGAIVAKQEIFLASAQGFFGAGLTYDGTDYYAGGGSATTTNRRIKGTGALLWDYTLGSTLYVGYTWSNGTVHTGISPLGSLVVGSGLAAAPLQRSQVIVTMPAIPTLATKNLVYALFAGSVPSSATLKLQSATTHASTETSPTVTFLTYDAAGANPTSSTYTAGGTPAAVFGDGAGVASSWRLNSSGVLRLPVGTKTQRDALDVVQGDLIFDSDTNSVEVFDGTIHKALNPNLVQQVLSIPSTAGGATGSLTVSITGLAVGDVVVWAGLSAGSAFTFNTDPVCTVAGQITLRFHNVDDASAHALATQTHTFLVFRRS